ncbi:MAG: 3-deoxy-D-manno-octulosonic acid transferase [Pseudomonadota bacterium]
MARPLALTAYLGLSRIAHPLARLLIRLRLARGKEDPVRYPERLGEPGLARPKASVIWFHGASVGEAMSILPLVRAYLDAAPDVEALMTTGTLTSARRLEGLLPPRCRHQFVPVDTAQAVRAFLDHWRPDLAIWVESEFWPRLMVETAARGIPMVLANARVSETSAKRWEGAGGMAAYLTGLFSAIDAQDDETVARLTALGTEPAKLRMAGNLKALAPVPEADPEALADWETRLGDRPVWLAASTHPGEEEAVLDAHVVLPPETVLILAPRHPDRGRIVAEMIKERQMPFIRLSLGEVLGPETRVILADTLGQMGLWLRLAPISFIGGSIVAMGGHTPFEPAAIGSAILHGPHTENFAPAYAALARTQGARQIGSDSELAREITVLSHDHSARAEMVARARVVQDLAPDITAMVRQGLALMAGSKP